MHLIQISDIVKIPPPARHLYAYMHAELRSWSNLKSTLGWVFQCSWASTHTPVSVCKFVCVDVCFCLWCNVWKRAPLIQKYQYDLNWCILHGQCESKNWSKVRKTDRVWKRGREKSLIHYIAKGMWTHSPYMDIHSIYNMFLLPSHQIQWLGQWP